MLYVRIKELRESAGLSQASLSEQLNIAQTSIGNYERGERVPDADIVVKLAQYFNVSVDYLLGRSNIKQPEETLKKYNYLLQHPEYASTIDQILSDMVSFINAADGADEKINAISEDRIKERLSVLGDFKYVFLLEKQTVTDDMAEQENKIIQALEFIKSDTIKFIEQRTSEVQQDFNNGKWSEERGE